MHFLQTRPSPVGALTSPTNELDEFDLISNRARDNSSTSPMPTQSNNNNINGE